MKECEEGRLEKGREAGRRKYKKEKRESKKKKKRKRRRERGLQERR